MTPPLSASRLNDFLGCAHHAALWLSGEKPPVSANATLTLIRDKGFEHEAAVLKTLESRFGSALRIPEKASLSERLAATQAAIDRGAPVIYQAALANGAWRGFPDFLVRGPKTGGRWSYSVEDAKLSRQPKAAHLLQLGVYAALLQEVTGVPAAGGEIHTGDGARFGFDLQKTAHITRRLMKRFEDFAALKSRQTRPIRNPACGQCAFKDRCEAEWRAEDSPIFVAGMRADQLTKLEAVGIKTLADLTKAPRAKAIPGIGADSVARLSQQARLQKSQRETGEPVVELLPVEPGRGFRRLPPPDKGDLFFDMEGDPLYPDGLEYLFGVWGPLGKKGAEQFHPIWAHDHPAEKVAFEALMRLFASHIKRYPAARIYHYAPYEPSALKRMAMRHATMEPELDQLLREQRFVDLYQITRQALRASTESYSLKDLEKIYWGKRSGGVATAGDSIVEYERWRDLKDQRILDEIGHYNKEDCVSTAKLRDWIEGLRPADGKFETRPASDSAVDPPSDRAQQRQRDDADRLGLAGKLQNSKNVSPEVGRLIGELLWFHQRTQKPQWWALFDRQSSTEEELIEDFESLGGLWLDPKTPVAEDGRSLVATYLFTPQQTKLEVGDVCKFASTLRPAGTIVALDEEAGRIELRRGAAQGDFPTRCSLVPDGPLDQTVLQAAVAAFAKRVIQGKSAGDKAMLALLERKAPLIKGLKPGAPLLDAGQDLVLGTVNAVVKLQDSYLMIQGPPGAGKTYTTSHAVLALLKQGKRVGVSSNSHKGINNLLEAIEARAAEAKFPFSGVKRAIRQRPETVHTGKFIQSVYRKQDVTEDHQLVGGTAFHFASGEELGEYDYLFVDEAGQVALGNLVAMAGCARNIVLVGDQMQLAQPVQGVHPGESGLSCLDYLMQGRATAPVDRGVLLNLSWRMHPDICGFISDCFYDGRLSAHPNNEERRLVLRSGAHPALRESGVSVVEIAHSGCTQVSQPEADVIKELIASLLKQSIRDVHGGIHRLTITDLLVVAPFNAQVNLLRRRLPDSARVGTVDKFQGQEAAVVIVSMTTSHGADAPRGSEFLFSPNRLNVALSRAQCLAILVRGKDLLELPPRTIPDLERLEPFARASSHSAAKASVQPRAGRSRGD